MGTDNVVPDAAPDSIPDDKPEKSPYWDILRIEESKDKMKALGIGLKNIPIIDKNSEHNVAKRNLCKTLVKAQNLPMAAPSTFRSRKIRCYPTPEQKKTLIEYFDDTRLLYNTIVSELVGTTKPANKFKMRDKYVTNKNNEIKDEKLLRTKGRTPAETREKAVFEACTAHDLSLKMQKTYKLDEKYKSLETNIKVCNKELLKIEKKLDKTKGKSVGKIEDLKKRQQELKDLIVKDTKSLQKTDKWAKMKSNLKRRTRKKQTAHVFIPKETCKVVDDIWTIFPRFKNGIGKLKVKELYGKNPTSDFQIQWNRKTNTWFIIVSEEIETKELPETSNYDTIVMDPGYKRFLYGVDFDNNVSVIGDEIYKNGVDMRESEFLSDAARKAAKTIEDRVKKLDFCANIDLRGKRGRERYKALKLKRSARLHQKKITNVINEYHKRVAKYLLRKYDVVVLPRLNVGSIIYNNNFSKSLNRWFLMLAHGKFHNYITWKASVLGKVVVNLDERYTSKTCFQCGNLNDPGGSRNYECESCGNKCDRDLQSCYNIMSKYMSGSYKPETSETSPRKVEN